MPETISDLVAIFMDETEAQFHYLISEYGFQHEAGLTNFDHPKPNLKKPELAKLPGLFSLVERYYLSNLRIEISYGGRELLVEGRWWYESGSGGFGLWEMVNAASRKDSAIGGAAFVNTSELMRSTIIEMAKSLKANMDLFEFANGELIERVLEIRGQVLEYESQRQRAKELERAKLEAKEAFREKKYRAVVDLLTPFSDIFSVADEKMMEICRRKI